MEKLVLVGGGPFAKCTINYIEDEEKSRFYIRTTSKDAEEALLKIAIEGLKVKFSGKVYEMNKEFAKDNKLPNDVKLYSLISPDYSITILDEQQNLH